MDLLYSGKPPSTSYLSDSSDHDYYFFFNEIPKLGQVLPIFKYQMIGYFSLWWYSPSYMAVIVIVTLVLVAKTCFDFHIPAKSWSAAIFIGGSLSLLFTFHQLGRRVLGKLFPIIC